MKDMKRVKSIEFNMDDKLLAKTLHEHNQNKNMSAPVQPKTKELNKL